MAWLVSTKPPPANDSPVIDALVSTPLEPVDADAPKLSVRVRLTVELIAIPSTRSS